MENTWRLTKKGTVIWLFKWFNTVMIFKNVLQNMASKVVTLKPSLKLKDNLLVTCQNISLGKMTNSQQAMKLFISLSHITWIKDCHQTKKLIQRPIQCFNVKEWDSCKKSILCKKHYYFFHIAWKPWYRWRQWSLLSSSVSRFQKKFQWLKLLKGIIRWFLIFGPEIPSMVLRKTSKY